MTKDIRETPVLQQENISGSQEEPLENPLAQAETCYASKLSPSVSHEKDSIDSRHPLWAMVLYLSSEIWFDLRDSLNDPTIPEQTLVDRVRRKAIDLLRAESVQPGLIKNMADADILVRAILNEVLGYGPLKALLEDQSVSEIIVTGPCCTYVERNGRVEEALCCFVDEQHILRVIGNLLRLAGRRMRSDYSIVDAYLPDGSLFTVTLPPNTVNGPTITIRRHIKRQFVMSELVARGSMSQQMANFLLACVQGRLNIVICGATHCGKTTLLNALCMCIPTQEHIVTIEEIAELHLDRRRRIALLSGCKGPGNAGRITARDLVQHAERMRPQRLIVGECRSDEVVELLRAIIGGQEGVMMTMYAHSVRDCLTRLEMLCRAGGMDIAGELLSAQLARSLDIFVQLSRLQDGSLKITNIVEILGADDNEIRFRSIFHYKDEGYDAKNGKATGKFTASGFAPTFLERFQAIGIHLPREIFVPCTIPLHAKAG